MKYIDLLRTSSERLSSLVCMGLDPIIDEIPLKTESIYSTITTFYQDILNSILEARIYPSAVKPNYAFYAQYGIEGIKALITVIDTYKSAGFPVILDAKRGDIGSTAEAYSREAFKFFNADAITISPFLGYDSIAPFVNNYPDKGVYVLNKTSNKSSIELQDVLIDGIPLYIYLARKIIVWNTGTLGAVVGATYPSQLEEISEVFTRSDQEIPLLIPGIGSQGGSIKDVCTILRKFDDPRIHRINSSSAINYAYKKYKGISFSDAAVKALSALNNEINSIVFD
jgi:orotidine-5'-phosphate decarboxylase